MKSQKKDAVDFNDLIPSATVMCRVSNDHGIYHVRQLSPLTHEVMLDGARNAEWHAVDHIRGIPVSEDVLISLGFKKPNLRPYDDHDFEKEYDFENVHLDGMIPFTGDHFVLGFVPANRPYCYLCYEGAGYDEEAHLWPVVKRPYMYQHEIEKLLSILNYIAPNNNAGNTGTD